MYKVFVDGSAGTTGLRIIQRISDHAQVELVKIADSERKNIQARAAAANSADLAILCLPDEAAREIIPLLSEHVKVCDTSTAHRTAKDWDYGFPEMGGRRESIIKSKRVSVPGCHASGFISLATPLVECGYISKDAKLTAWSLTGYTGGGNAMIGAYEAKDRPLSYDSPRSYGLSLKHKHLPEMCKVSGLNKGPLFSPIVADFPRGMAVYLPLCLDMLQGVTDAKAVHDALSVYYEGELGVKVMPYGTVPDDGFLAANALAGSDNMYIYCFSNGDDVLLCSVFDNLGKGSSGAAIQCMNLMLGLPEREGLE